MTHGAGIFPPVRDGDRMAERYIRSRRPEQAEDREEWIPRQVVWGVGPAIALQYQEDLLSDLWTLTDPLDAVRDESDLDELPYAIHRLGIGAPRNFNDGVFTNLLLEMSKEGGV